MINKPYTYMGNKGRFYKEIKRVFEESKKGKYVDLFAGGLEVPVNIKNDFQDVEVIANVKDINVEAFLKIKNKVKIYKEVIKYISGEDKLLNLYKDKEKWNEAKLRYKEWLLSAEEDKKNYIKLLCSMNGGLSLASKYYSEKKIEKIKIFVQSLKPIKITNEYFNKDKIYTDSFILLDPPYIKGTGIGNKSNEKGYNYKKASKSFWNEDSDKELVFFIKNNLNRNNTFMIWGSENNNLSKLIRTEFEDAKFIDIKYRKNIFGKVSERLEWYCII